MSWLSAHRQRGPGAEGAGNLLGEARHGHIQAVGLGTCVDLVREAVSQAGGDMARERLDAEIEVPVPAFIPETCG